MALNFTTVETTQWIGQVNGLPTKLCGKDGRVVAVPINWNIYGVGTGDNLGLQVDMTGIAPSNQLDLIRSVYIDNIGSPTAMYVYFPDTGFTAVAAPYSAVWQPVITNARQATIYGIGFLSDNIPLTNIFFTNIFVPYSVQTLGPELNVSPAVALYTGDAVSNQAQNVTLAQFTFAAVPIGVADAARRVVVAVTGGLSTLGAGAADAVVASLSVGGVAASLLERVSLIGVFDIQSIGDTFWSNSQQLELWIADVPLGATGAIVVNWSVARNSCRVMAWSLNGIISSSAYGSAGGSAGSLTGTTGPGGPTGGNVNLPGSISVGPRGCIIAAYVGINCRLNSTVYPDEPTITGGTKSVAAGLQSLSIGGTGGTQLRTAVLSNPADTNNTPATSPAYALGANWPANCAAGLYVAASFIPG